VVVDCSSQDFGSLASTIPTNSTSGSAASRLYMPLGDAAHANHPDTYLLHSISHPLELARVPNHSRPGDVSASFYGNLTGKCETARKESKPIASIA